MPFPSDFIDVERGANVDFENVLITGGGSSSAGLNPAINDFGTVTIGHSALSGNDGDQLFVNVGANATVTDSTIAAGLGAGITDDGKVSLFNSTVAYNAFGIGNQSGVLNLTNSIVAENSVSSGGFDCGAPATTVDHSLDSDGSCGVAAPLSKVDPGLTNNHQGPVFDGGTTPDYPLIQGSPAIGAGDSATCLETDQRGVMFDKPCDIGSDETGATTRPPASSSSGGAGGGSSTQQPSTSASGTTGPTGSKGTTTVSDTGVRGRGTVRGRRGTSISFAILVVRGRRRGTFDYTDPSRHLALRAVSITAVTINTARRSATITGLATNGAAKRRLRFIATVDCAPAHASLAVRLSSGYRHSGVVVRGSLRLTQS
jgi:hypothetical protein